MIRAQDELFNGKPSACVRPVGKPDIGYLYQHFAAARYRNKRVRYSLHIKTKRAHLGAGAFFDVYDADSDTLITELDRRDVLGTKDWTKIQIEFDVPLEAYAISIGAILHGPGEMYLGGLEFDVI